MAVNRGKPFEAKFKEDFLKIPGATLDRIYDSTNGHKGVSNICDFICYVFPYILYAETKSINENTFPINNLTQYERLLEKKGIRGVKAGAIIWFVKHDRVIFCPIETFEKLKLDGFKSVNILKTDFNEYPVIEIPSVKKRVYMDSDYSVLFKEE